ncbi:MAG: zinc ABC transporter substrate-binding protein [Candidatus Moranbacteria bacterium]|nr:zinc ABC transporter substrate-binding protein [Candidatus Moranbacteria bacterium]MBP6034421.1 zinc ABC transporter substrate-binding protein [Candidatus Moranbacteria bacterium]MBP7695704.1 zinc ABC transporter substrate-binding protein [Candidatus Moranbacteria bacterium]
MKKGYVIFGVVSLLLLSGAYWLMRDGIPADQQTPQDDRLRIVVSFFPYGEFARAVVGDRATVSELVPSGVEPHDFEPTPRDIEQMYRADIVIINGAGIDAWAEKVARELPERGVRVIRMADGIELLSASEEEHEEENQEISHEESGNHSADPHFWLDPILAESQVRTIAQVIGEQDEQHRDFYQARAEVFALELGRLDQEYQTGLRQCRLRTIVTSHDAFAYLAKRYLLETVSIAGLSPDAEPSSQRLAEIARETSRLGVKFIFFETLSSPKLAQTLASELGIGTLVFDPIEGSPVVDGARATYTELMRSNLRNLEVALECL